jgi:hypothetical protein
MSSPRPKARPVAARGSTTASVRRVLPGCDVALQEEDAARIVAAKVASRLTTASAKYRSFLRKRASRPPCSRSGGLDPYDEFRKRNGGLFGFSAKRRRPREQDFSTSRQAVLAAIRCDEPTRNWSFIPIAALWLPYSTAHGRSYPATEEGDK